MKMSIVPFRWALQMTALFLFCPILIFSFIITKRKYEISSCIKKITSMSIDQSMFSTYDALSTRVMTNIKKINIQENQQYWICIAGGPGSGKSTLAAALTARLNSVSNRDDFCVVLPMDGFHYSRQQLKDIASNPNSNFTFEDLIARRGSPWTFNATALCSELWEARKNRQGTLPVYSRTLSDPIPDGVFLTRSHQVVIVEGNYMLNYVDPLWAPLESLFNEKWFLSCESVEKQRERLINRHLETWTAEKSQMWGSGREGAAKKADSNDVLNMRYVSFSAQFADLNITSV